jgi:uncharacterized tellurite resistance protein B-like protein
MTGPQSHLALARLLAAAAWADGHADEDEVNAVKRFLLRFRFSPDDIRSVSLLLEAPVPRTEAERLAQEFVESVRSEADRHALLAHLTELFEADGKVTSEESEFLRSVQDLVESQPILDVLLARVRGLLSPAVFKPGRDRRGLADVLRSRLQGRVREKLRELSAEAAQDVDRLNYAALFGAMLQKVALADGTLSPEESARVAEALRARFGFADDEVSTIVATLETQVSREIDLQRLAAEFNRLSDQEGRVQLVRALFTVAAADREIRDEEVDEMRRIADLLWVDRREFNEIRLSFVRR